MASRQEQQFQEESYRPKLASNTRQLTKDNGESKLPSIEELKLNRGDREPHQFRPAFLKTSIVSSASGSAYIEFGQTKVLCSIYGPKPKQQGKSVFSNRGAVVCDLRYAPFATQTASRQWNRQTADEKMLSEVVRQAIVACIQLDKFPKSVLEVNLMILEDDGGSLSAAVNCASAALVDSGVELFDTARCSTVALLKCSGQKNKEEYVVAVDPTAQEEATSVAIAHLAMANPDSITAFECQGQVDPVQSGNMVLAGTHACQAIFKVMSDQLVQLAIENSKSSS